MKLFTRLYSNDTGIRDTFLISLRGIENKTKMQYNNVFGIRAPFRMRAQIHRSKTNMANGNRLP